MDLVIAFSFPAEINLPEMAKKGLFFCASIQTGDKFSYSFWDFYTRTHSRKRLNLKYFNKAANRGMYHGG